MLSGLSGLSGLSAVCGGAASTPTAPDGAAFAVVAHPSCCRSDAACTVPCGDGDAIRWWRELVTGVWYEQATSGARPILRASGGKWYAELRVAGPSTFVFGSSSKPPELIVGCRSPNALWDGYGGFLNLSGSIFGRLTLTEWPNASSFHSNIFPTTVWRNGVSVTPSPFDLAPIDSWMKLAIRPDTRNPHTGSITLTRVPDIDSFYLSLDISAAATFGGTRSAGEQVADLAWLVEYTP